ncbi:MAG: holo-ACP synthase [Actinomycetota bacterium]
MDPRLDPAIPDVGPGPDRDLPPAPALDGLIGQVVVAIGVDLVDIDRIREVLDRQPGFAERVFTAAERDYCDRRHDPAERYAARFAAKEAVLKALGTGLGGGDFHDIEVVRQSSGEPVLSVTGRAAAAAEARGIRRWLITMTHSDHLAQVVVAGLGGGPDEVVR